MIPPIEERSWMLIHNVQNVVTRLSRVVSDLFDTLLGAPRSVLPLIISSCIFLAFLCNRSFQTCNFAKDLNSITRRPWIIICSLQREEIAMHTTTQVHLMLPFIRFILSKVSWQYSTVMSLERLSHKQGRKLFSSLKAVRNSVTVIAFYILVILSHVFPFPNSQAMHC